MNTNTITVAFFTEAGSKRGMGHLVRLYTIYQEFAAHTKIKAEFFLDSDTDYTYKFDNIHPFKWENFSLKNFYDAIFIDSYEANEAIYALCAQQSKLAVYLDDYGRVEYPKGMIINFAPDADTLFFQHKQPQHTYLLGLKYLPLRKVFFDLTRTKQPQIFIMLGGSDTAGLSLDILDALENIAMKKVVINNDQETMKTLKTLKNTQVLYKPSDQELANCIAKSALAITTASMSIYELAFLQIPTIIVAVAKNQLLGAPQLIKHHLAVSYVSLLDANWKQTLYKETVSIIQSDPKINSPIDAQGAKRIFTTVLELLQ